MSIIDNNIFTKDLKNETLYDNYILNQSIPTKSINFFGTVDGPLKRNFKGIVDKMLNKHKKIYNFNYIIPEVSAEQDDYKYIWQTDDINEFPDVCISGGFANFFKKDFVNKFVNRGYFQSENIYDINKDFIDTNCVDPEGIYTMYGANPFVMLIDKSELGNLPVPKRWSDLLKPCYKNKIIISGSSREKVYYLLPSYIHKEHGYEGVKRLAKNLKDVRNTAKMARNAGSNNDNKAAIYVMTWLFAKSCPNTDCTEIVWPEDGAIISPLLMISKKARTKQIDVFTKILMSEEFGRKSAELFCPVINPRVNNNLPHNSKLKWIGWDYLRNNNINVLKKDFQNIFDAEWIRRSSNAIKSNTIETDFLNSEKSLISVEF